MISGFYSAKSGLSSYQEQMNVISNNLANVNTSGFKPMRVSFTDLMYQNLNRAASENEAMVGRGVKINGTAANMSQGPLQATNYALDFALTEENTFFAVMDGEGNVFYTRSGSFILSGEDGEDFFLSTGDGYRVLDPDMGEIEIAFDDEGNLELQPSDIGVFRFANPYGLSATGDNRYVETALSGEPVEVEDPGLMNGYLEGSNVDTSNEMVKVIEASKAFSFNSRMVQVADEVEQIVNNLR